MLYLAGSGGTLNCPSCEGKNRDDARFCTFCGTTLALSCSACGTDLVPGARFCDSCGAPVAAEPAAEPVAAARKVVTVLFADMTASTSLEEEMDAETVRSLIDRFYAALRAEVDKRGGRVVKFTGDGLMAAFGVPEVREDDAPRAIETALAMCSACEDLAQETGHPSIALKVGLNTGEVVVIEDSDDVVGDAVNVASRLESAAKAGEVLVGEETWRLTRGMSRYEEIAPLSLKGKAEPVPAYRLLSVEDQPADTLAGPFVGRDAELAKLLEAFDDAVGSNAARLVTIIGSPGLGKTRLTRELGAALADRAVVHESRCDPAGSATFAPIAETVRAGASIPDAAEEREILDTLAAAIPENDPDRERIASRVAAILGAGEPGSTEETFWALRRMIETAARTLPRVLVLDDLHWAEPLLLDLVEHMAEWIRDAPVLIVGTGRPELRDLRPSLAESGRAVAVIALEGLDEADTARLATGLLGTEEVPPELLARIPASTEGNPLFVRELVRMLVDDGVLARTGDGWSVTVDVEAIQVPPTIQSLLAARVDRLRPDERTIVELASVIGKEFYRGALHEVAPPAVRDQIDTCLESLRRKELVEPAGTYWIDEPVHRFHHVLIQDAAYRRMLKETRADLHERVAGWLERKTADVLGEHEEVIGYHLEQAHIYLSQLGRANEALGRRAAALLAEAAQRALDRDDLPAAAALSGRALELLPDEDEERSALLLIRCEVLLSMGDVTAGGPAVGELEEMADTPRLAAWATCFACELANLTAPERLQETEKRVAAAASELAGLGDIAGAAKAHTVHAATLTRLGRFGECESVLDHALTAAREADDRRRITACLGGAFLAQLWGANPVSRAGGRCLDLVRLSRITTKPRSVEVTSLRCQAVLEALRGRADAARRMLEGARETLTEMGLRNELLETDQFAGIVELVAGDAAAAVPHLRSAHEGFQAEGVDVLAAQTAALLARAYLLLGDDDGAERFAGESERLGGQDLKASIAWRAVRAEVLARRGEVEEPRRLAESAVELAARTDALIDHGDACLTLAAVCRAAGDADAARRAESQAVALYERKGATALIHAQRPTPAAEPESTRTIAGLPVNECFRVVRRIEELFGNRDWEAVERELAEEMELRDRRRLVGTDVVGRQAYMAHFKLLSEIGTVEIFSTPVAMRGERLALCHCRFSGRDLGSDPFQVELLQVFECDQQARLSGSVAFDLDDLDSAMTELDRRFLEGEGVAYASTLKPEVPRAVNARDWQALRSHFADDMAVIDHRPASLGRIEATELVEAIRAMTEVAPDFRWIPAVIHRIDANRCLVRLVVTGSTPDGVGGNLDVLTLHRVREGRIAHIEIFPDDQLEAALGRFDELDARGDRAVGALDNQAVRAAERLAAMFEARDWSGWDAAVADDVTVDDRRALIRDPALGRAAVVEQAKSVADTGILRALGSPVAIRGEGLALNRLTLQGREVGSAPFETELLQLFDFDDDGLLKRMVLFDADDLDGAITELDEAFTAGEAHAHRTFQLSHEVLRAMNQRDWDAYRSLLKDDLAQIDHRPASLGEINGADNHTAAIRELAEIVPALYFYIAAVHALEPTRALIHMSAKGRTDEGDDIDVSFLGLYEFDEESVGRIEVYPLEDLDAALARIDELGLKPAERSPSNAASTMDERLLAFMLRNDWEALSELLAAETYAESRRSGLQSLLTGREAVLDDIRTTITAPIVGDYACVATRGQRLSLSRQFYRGAIPESAFEVELLMVTELDDQGRIAGRVTFDTTCLDAAMTELDERFLAGEGSAHADLIEVPIRVARAINGRDWHALRSLFADDVSIVDYRPASLGVINGPDPWIESLKELVQLYPLRCDNLAYHALERDRLVAQWLVHGVTSDGAEVESAFHSMVHVRQGRIVRVEFFSVERLDAALDRLEDSRRLDSGVATANTCTLVVARAFRHMRDREWDALQALVAGRRRSVR